jgi:hypothetical protein
MEREKFIDESWKDSVNQEKNLNQDKEGSRIITPGGAPAEEPSAPAQEQEQNPMEVNFINYISSLVFQTMIFLGELPNPITNEMDKNLAQAKFLIDTLIVIREKTKGNLTKAEDDLINSAVYELEMRFVDQAGKESQGGGHAGQ